MFMYSAHDTTVSFILNSLGVFDGLAPPYASAILFELLHQEHQWYLQISYKNETDAEPYVLTIPGCQQKCPLDKFKLLTLDVRPSDWNAECQIEDQGGIELGSIIMKTIQLCFLVIIGGCLLVLYKLVIGRRAQRREYDKL